MLDFKSILSTLRAAVDAKLTGEATKLAPLNTEAIGFVEKTVAPHLDISPNIVAIASTQNATIEKAVEPLEIAGLQFLQARIDALL